MTAILIIADDHLLFRNALKELLASSNFEIVAEVENCLEAIKLVDELDPDLLLCDIKKQPFSQ